MAGEINLRLDQLTKNLADSRLAQEAYKTFYQNTPRRSGNAQSRTTLQGDEIRADYPYAQRLDDGWSNQRPDGMTKPTMAAVEDYIRRQAK